MAELERLTDAELRSAMVCYRNLLRSHRQALNRLNVYPVADADTGTNMTLTVESVVAPLEEATDMASTCRAISRGALLGAGGSPGSSSPSSWGLPPPGSPTATASTGRSSLGR